MKTSIFTRISRVFMVLIVVSVLLSAAPSTAQAYGNDALWQIGLSFNCNNQDLCLTPPFGVGLSLTPGARETPPLLVART